ncbi:MAG: hypothetical protein ACE15B_20500 [Bryobacteraceae bacterium]
MRLTSLLHDPPPALAFEVSEAGVAAARLRPKREIAFYPLKPGVISASPLQDNVLSAEELAAAVRALAGPNGTRKRRDAALIIPDYATRMAVLDFDEFPSDRGEQLSLVRFRMKKTVPFDIESAAVSYWAQPAGGKKHDVLVTVSPIEIVSRYEAPFLAAGLNPGLVTTSALAFLDLVDERGLAVAAKVSGKALTVLVLDKGRVRMVRCLEPGPDLGAELFPTLVYIEDQFGAKAEKLLIAGFGDRTEAVRAQLGGDLGIAVEPVRTAHGLAGENDAGLRGYLRSVAAE